MCSEQWEGTIEETAAQAGRIQEWEHRIVLRCGNT